MCTFERHNTNMCHMFACVQSSEVSLKFVKSFIIISQYSLPPLFLVYSVCHVVSCLLMDSHWSSTCNSLIAAAEEWFNLLTVRPVYESFHTAVHSFLGKMLPVLWLPCCVWNKHNNRRRNDEFAWLNSPPKKEKGNAAPKETLAIKQKLKVMTSYGLQL